MASFSDELVGRLASARSVGVLTGAGISAESGVPTFRDLGGLWQRFRPEELANLDAFLRNPSLVQAWYGHRRRLLRDVEPNAGHRALADLEHLVTDGEGEFLLATQNVDNLHQLAGSERLVELHGNLTRSYCIECGRDALEEELDGVAEGEACHCADCSGLVRPDVVWFGEVLPMDALQLASEVAARADVFLSVGTSGVVFPAAGIPLTATASGAYVVEINVEPSAISAEMSEVVIGRAGEVLPAIVEAVRTVRAAHSQASGRS